MQKLHNFLAMWYTNYGGKSTMVSNDNLKNRDTYLRQLIAFQDKELIKVITGIRRSGKSKLLVLMVNHLLEEGKSQDQIIEMHFEKMEFSLMTKL